MDFLNRYRNITVLFLVIFGQLLLLAVQVKSDRNVPIIRVWTVTAITPFARVLEALRGGGTGFFRNYIFLHNADAENRRLHDEVDRLKMDNIFLRDQLNTADRAHALALFQQHTQSKTLAAIVIASGAGVNSKVVFVDRGSGSGVERGMAVVTPDGIVGKVVAVYPTASQVLLVTDPDFAAGVISQKGGVRGTFKGQGSPMGLVDYVSNSEKVELGEWFYTSGDDRIFPRGFPVGVVKSVHSGSPFQQVLVAPSGIEHGIDEVLIVIEGVHREIPPVQTANQPVYIAPPPPDADAVREAAAAEAGATPTEADKLRAIYQAAGEAQGHEYGRGYKPPDLLKLPAPGNATAAPASNGATPSQSPPSPAAAPPAAVHAAPPAAPPATASGAPPAPKTVPNQRLANQAAGAQSGTSGH
ncbi:MAG: rod shape-determining protein MreC [Bryobacteraceae bacterium]